MCSGIVECSNEIFQFCHGSGRSTEESQNDAASHALLLISGETDTETIAPVTASLEGQAAAAAATEAIAATSSKSKVSGVNVVESNTTVGSNQVADDGIIVVSAAAAAPSSNVIQVCLLTLKSVKTPVTMRPRNMGRFSFKTVNITPITRFVFNTAWVKASP